MSTTHYVDNKQLYAVIIEYKTQIAVAEAEGNPKPRIPDYVGACILMIANRLSTKPNFVNYSYREEMISDGIENCISYFDNFDPSKSDNPFAYFTQIIYYAFLRRIQKEKKQLYIKHKAIENSMVFNTMVEQGEGDEIDVTISAFDYSSEMTSEFIKSFEDNMNKKKLPVKKGLELFIEDDEQRDADERDE